MDTHRDRGGGENPIAVGSKPPAEIALFLLGLGYEQANVVNTLARHCNLDTFTARRIVREAAHSLHEEVR